MTKVEIKNTEELPLCPHCDKKLETILKNITGSFERHTIYICPHCKNLLSVGNDMGLGS